MSPDEKKLLESTYSLAKANNAMLRSMKRSQTISAVLKLCYWVIIIGLTGAAFQLIKPYLNTLEDAVGKVQNVSDNGTKLLNQIQSLGK